MDGLSEICPGSVPIVIGGETWQLAPLRLKDYAAMERKILAGRERPLDIAIRTIAKLPEAERRLVVSSAYDEERRGLRVTRQELAEWRASFEGRVFEFWLRLQKNHPDKSESDADQLLSGFALESEDVNAFVAKQTGEIPLGNSPSRVAPGTPVASPSASPGAGSSGT